MAAQAAVYAFCSKEPFADIYGHMAHYKHRTAIYSLVLSCL
ncbi:hypothetical protein HMPREF1247_0718 [Atopobium sp. BV3Ac4]|nr:hypothetical protein HMPREF1247_0718 [Atopobium sp. BV3Ac4]